MDSATEPTGPDAGSPPKRPKKAKPKAPAKRKAKKAPAKRKAKKAREPAKKAVKVSAAVRTERLDFRLTKAEKARVMAKAKGLRRTVTSLFLEAVEKIR